MGEEKSVGQPQGVVPTLIVVVGGGPCAVPHELVLDAILLFLSSFVIENLCGVFAGFFCQGPHPGMGGFEINGEIMVTEPLAGDRAD